MLTPYASSSPGRKKLIICDPIYQCEPTPRLSRQLAPPPTPKRQLDNKMCTRTVADIYFLLDLSKTVTKQNLETAIGMIRNMIRLFSYGDDGVKIAIGTFALTFGEVFPFSKYDTRQDNLVFNMLLCVLKRRKKIKRSRTSLLGGLSSSSAMFSLLPLILKYLSHLKLV